MATSGNPTVNTYEDTLRRRPAVYPMSPDEYEQMCPEEDITVAVVMTFAPPLTLVRTDTDGYYCMKRDAIPLLEEGMSSGLSLGESLQRQIKFFIERDGGTEIHNNIAYISQNADEVIQSLLQAYKKLQR